MPARPADPPRWVAPMRAELGPLPVGDGWSFELKWDGMRIIARTNPVGGPNSLTLWARSGRDVTSTYAELGDLPGAIGAPAVVDGEAVVFDGVRPAFERLQHRIHVANPTQALVTAYPVIYLLFDLLELDGRSLVTLPYHQRRRLLNQLVEPGPSWQVPPGVDGDGAALLELAGVRGLEGVMAKRTDGPYRPGVRSADWVKTKLRHKQEFVVGGWLPGQGRLEGTLGSLLLGVHDDTGLVFVGAAGSGITEAQRARINDLLIPSATCPFTQVPVTLRPPRWVRPTLVVEVEYGSWTREGNLRHPTYLGILPDHDPAEVVRELPSGPPGAR